MRILTVWTPQFFIFLIFVCLGVHTVNARRASPSLCIKELAFSLYSMAMDPQIKNSLLWVGHGRENVSSLFVHTLFIIMGVVTNKWRVSSLNAARILDQSFIGRILWMLILGMPVQWIRNWSIAQRPLCFSHTIIPWPHTLIKNNNKELTVWSWTWCGS